MIKDIRNKLGKFYDRFQVLRIDDYYLVNTCPHPIHDITSGIFIDKAKEPLRVITQTKVIGKIANKANIYKTDILIRDEDIPPRIDKVFYIISALASNYIPKNRTDFIVPGNVERNENNEIIGCRGFRLPNNSYNLY